MERTRDDELGTIRACDGDVPSVQLSVDSEDGTAALVPGLSSVRLAAAQARGEGAKMIFDTYREALTWLDAHPACQKALYIDLGEGVFVGDFDNLPGVKDDWIEVSYRRLSRAARQEATRCVTA